MKRLIILTILFLTVLFSFGQEENFNSFEWNKTTEIPSYKDDSLHLGLAASFAGTSNGALIVAGGCNFPYKPVYQGGKKKYYKNISVFYKNKWYQDFHLETAVAYGATVQFEDGIVCIGGKNNEGCIKKVLFIRWNEKTKKIETQDFPALPFGIAQFSASIIKNTIYVAAGERDGIPKNNFLSINLENKKEGWHILEEFPGSARLQPVMVAQNAAEEKCLYLMSGSVFPDSVSQPIINTDVLCYSPKHKKWTKIADIEAGGEKRSLHGAYGAAMGVQHIVCVGGVNKDIFREALNRERKLSEAIQNNDSLSIKELLKAKNDYFLQKPTDFKFNNKVLIFHTITNKWTLADYPFNAPTGAPLVKKDDGFWVVSGEIKPGQRSPEIYEAKITRESNFGFINWTVLIIYMFCMLFLGYFFMKRGESTDDFFKGGGRIPWWAAGMSIFATMLSAITFMAIPAKTYATDWRYFTIAITIFIMAYPVVKYYLPYFRKLNITTAYEYLEVRFNAATRVVSSVVFIIFMVARMALVLFLPSLALTTVTGIDIYVCILLMGAITVIYSTMGGVEAVVWGDVIQGFVLLFGAVLAIIFLVMGTEGGLSQMIDITIEHNKMRTFDFAFDLTQPTFWVVLFGGLALNLISYSSDQAVIQRYMTTKDEKSASKSIWLNGVLSVLVSVIFYSIGTALYSYYTTNPEELNILMGNPDSIFPHFIMSKMPVGIAGIMIAAIFSATMSTVSTNINSVSTAFTTDIYMKINKQSSDKMRLKTARIASALSGLIGLLLALLMATWNILSLFDYFNFILGLLTSGLGGLFFMGIFIKRIKGKAALLAFASGTIILYIFSFISPVSFMLYGFVGLAATVISGYLFSFIFK